MKMRRLVVIALVISMLLAIPMVANAASPAPGGPFSTAFRVQNLDSSNATCVYVFYNAAGTAAFTSAGSTITPGDSLYVYTPSVSGLANGTYSGVVSCDKKVAAVVNFSDADSGASHNGVNAPATTWYAPGIYDNFYGFYSNIVVQNATSASVNATVQYFAPGSSTPADSETKAIPAYASAAFEQEGRAGLANNVAYSAKIVGTGDVAAVVNIYGSTGTAAQLYSYNPFSSGSKTVYAPVIMNAYYGYNTALTVQNIGANATDVTVTYGTGQTETKNVAAGSSALFLTSASPLAVGTLTGATVTAADAAGQIVALVNESTNLNRAASYSAFPAGSTSVSAPIVMKRYYGYNTSVVCQNVGAAATTMTIAYSGGVGGSTSVSTAVGKTVQFYQPDAVEGLSDNYVGSATITATQPIVCVVNEDMNEVPNLNKNMDQLFAYEGIAK
ncbi:MAG: hypothetical protein WAU10_00285 [Caldilineaceae bacterium]